MEIKVAPIIIGIDPGKSGSIVILRSNGKVEKYKMPETPRDLNDLMRTMRGNYLCFLEKVHGMPGMSGGGMFRFGENYGWITMALISNSIKTELVTPQKWMAYYEFGTKGSMTGTQWKNKLRAKAQMLFPKEIITLQFADALLIAEYGRRFYNSNLK